MVGCSPTSCVLWTVTRSLFSVRVQSAESETLHWFPFLISSVYQEADSYISRSSVKGHLGLLPKQGCFQFRLQKVCVSLLSDRTVGTKSISGWNVWICFYVLLRSTGLPTLLLQPSWLRTSGQRWLVLSQHSTGCLATVHPSTLIFLWMMCRPNSAPDQIQTMML